MFIKGKTLANEKGKKHKVYCTALNMLGHILQFVYPKN